MSYQAYATIAMHISRYVNSARWGSTEDRIACEFAAQATQDCGGSSEAAILFGQSRNDLETVKAKLTVTYQNRTGEALECMRRLLLKNQFQKGGK